MCLGVCERAFGCAVACVCVRVGGGGGEEGERGGVWVCARVCLGAWVCVRERETETETERDIDEMSVSLSLCKRSRLLRDRAP